MEEEISLREIIETLLEGKWIIASITAIAMVISVVLSYFVITPTYEAEATIMINQTQDPEATYLDNYVNDMISPVIFAEHLKSPGLINTVIEKENLQKSNWTASKLRKAINVEVKPETNLITVKLKGTNPEQVSQIVNALVKSSKQYSALRINDKMNKLVSEYEKQMIEEQEKINEAIKEYNVLKAGSGLPALVLLQETVKTAKTDQTPQLLLEANQQLLEEFKTLDKGKQVEFSQINDKIAKLSEQYNELYKKVEDAKSYSVMAATENKITRVADAVPPDSPVSPKKLLNIAIAIVVGMMVGVFVAFFRAYWRNSAVRNNSIKQEQNNGVAM